MRIQHVTLTTILYVFFVNETATTEIYTLSLHDALPICASATSAERVATIATFVGMPSGSTCETTLATPRTPDGVRSEEHTSELQSRQYLVCRLLLEKKNETMATYHDSHPEPHSTCTHRS